MEPVDVLYILGNGSPFNNEELRYSLRSLEKMGKNVGRVVIVGEDPGFLNDQAEFHYIPEAKGNKEYRIAKKILNACDFGYVQGNFLFCNDDYLFHRPFDAASYPFYHRGDLPKLRSQGHYRRSLYNTYKYLSMRRLPFRHFDIHVPILYNAKRFQALRVHWQASSEMYEGMVVKSLYANMYGIQGQRTSDVKISHLGRQMDRIKMREVFSYSDAGFRSGVKAYAQRMFPAPSKWELKR